MAVSPDGQRISSASWDKALRSWDADTGRPLLVLQGHCGKVNCLAQSRAGTDLVSGSEDRTLKIWGARTGQVKRTLRGHAGSVFFGFPLNKIGKRRCLAALQKVSVP